MKQYLLAGLLAGGITGSAWAQQQDELVESSVKTVTVKGGVVQAPALPLDSLTHKITYSAVVQVPGASKAELYGRALR